MQKAPKLFCLMALGLASTGVLAADYYVAPTGDDGAAGDSGAPFATIAHALTLAQDDDTIHLADGTYVEWNLVLDKAVHVVGDSGNRDAVILNANASKNIWHGGFTISAAGASIANLTIKNAIRDSLGGGLYMTANGTVSNCVFSNNQFAGNIAGGGNVYMTDGLLVDCLLTGGGQYNSYSQKDLSISLQGGRMMRCRIEDVSSSGKGGRAIRIGSGGVMENCLILRVNVGSANKGDGVINTDGKLINCTIAKCSAKNNIVYANNNAPVVNCVFFDTTPASPVSNSAGGVRNCVSATAMNDTCFAFDGDAAANFKDTVDYVPLAGSVMINNGSDDLYDTYAVSETDLVGTGRILGDAIDIGCYELNQSSFSCTPVVSADGLLKGGSADFTATVTGVASPLFQWTFGDGESLTTPDAECSHTFNATGLFLATVRVSGDGGTTWSDPFPALNSVRVSEADLYIDPVNGSDTNDGSKNAPFATILAARGSLTNDVSEGKTVVDGVTIHLADGDYADYNIQLNSAITVIGDSGNRDAVVVNPGELGRGFVLQGGATLASVTVTNAHANANGVCASIGSGCMATNCVFACGVRTGASGWNGVNAVVSGGTLVDSVLIGGSGPNNYGTDGTSLYADSARIIRTKILDTRILIEGSRAMSVVFLAYSKMENCLVKGCASSGGSSGNGEHQKSHLVLARYGSEKIVNCTFVDNDVATDCIGLASSAGATIANCVFFNNDARAWGTNPERFFNCASDIEITGGNNCVVIDESAFVNYAKGNYRPAAGLANGGSTWEEYLGYGATSDKDLAGEPRLLGKAVDIGCYEFTVGGTIFMLK